MKKELTKKVTISMTSKEQDKARKIAEKIFGSQNISGLFRYWVNKYKL